MAARNPTVVRSIPLPPPGPFAFENFAPGDVEVIDLDVGRKIRLAYTTTGDIDELNGVIDEGRLRFVDIPKTLPADLTDATAWSNYLAGVDIQNPVANWNQVLGGDNSDRSKRIPLVGMTSHNGYLYVCGSSRNALNESGNFFKPPWNGLSSLYALTSPDVAFDPANGVGQELYSAGISAEGNGFRAAVPEGTAVQYLDQPLGASGTYLFVANYCGADAGGHLLVQDITNPTAVDPFRRYSVPLYELLADWLETLPTTLTTDLTKWPLGPEVDRDWFTCPLDANNIPDCSGVTATTHAGSSINSLQGNKLRSTVTFTVPDDGVAEGEPGDANNDGRTFLVAVLNLDPIGFPSEYNPDGSLPVDHVPLDARTPCGATTETATRDDGKYDYLCIVDITDMVSTTNLPLPIPPAGDDFWWFDGPAEWAARARFVRLPPDLPAGWNYTLGEGQIPDDSGYDFSDVTVFGIDDFGTAPGPSTPSVKVPIVGSGTLKSMAVRPDGKFLYLVASDQGQENVAENETLTDGGLHVPHLYVIDLTMPDFEDAAVQTWLNDPPVGFIRSYRFNKVATGNCLECDTDPPCPDEEFQGMAAINSTIPGFPITPAPAAGIPVMQITLEDNSVIDAVGITGLNGAALADVGAYYPGEHQGDPTARTRLYVLENDDLVTDPIRLYVGTTGFSQLTNEIFGSPRQGAVFSIAVDPATGSPSYHDTLTIDQNAPEQVDHWSLGGLDFIGNERFLTPTVERNIISVVARHSRPKNYDSIEDRLVLLEDR